LQQKLLSNGTFHIITNQGAELRRIYSKHDRFSPTC